MQGSTGRQSHTCMHAEVVHSMARQALGAQEQPPDCHSLSHVHSIALHRNRHTLAISGNQWQSVAIDIPWQQALGADSTVTP